MSLQTRLLSLITAVGADVKTLMTRTQNISSSATNVTTVAGTLTASGAITQSVASGPTLQTGYVVILHTDSAPPTNTPAGTLVIKKRT